MTLAGPQSGPAATGTDSGIVCNDWFGSVVWIEEEKDEFGCRCLKINNFIIPMTPEKLKIYLDEYLSQKKVAGKPVSLVFQ
jgi:hypothetical protein